MRLLAVGDVHLGRRPSGVPEGVLERGVDSREIGPPEALRRAIRLGREANVDAILFAGDAVDDENDVHEGYSRLRSALDDLTGAEIPVFAVAGNHDVRVLPRIARELEGFALVGAGGRWQTHELVGRDGARATLVGWSFADVYVERSPLAGFPATLGALPRPYIGLLHADLDQSTSRYAPVSKQALLDLGLDAWLLGHVHVPGDLARVDPPIGYLGALTALDPSDLGPRGPWLVDIDAGGRVSLRHVPLAPLRFEERLVDVSDLTNAGDLAARLQRAVREAGAEAARSEYPPRALGLRIRLHGRHRRRRAIEERAREEDVHALVDESHKPTVAFVERVYVDIEPDVDLAALARDRHDPPAILARTLLVLERASEDPERRELLARAREEVRRTAEAPAFGMLDAPNLDDETLAAYLRAEGRRLLSAMLEQAEQLE